MLFCDPEIFVVCTTVFYADTLVYITSCVLKQ